MSGGTVPLPGTLRSSWGWGPGDVTKPEGVSKGAECLALVAKSHS